MIRSGLEGVLRLRGIESLQEKYRAAKLAFEGAETQLNANIVISGKAEYTRLRVAADVAWRNLNEARKRLHEHILAWLRRYS